MNIQPELYQKRVHGKSDTNISVDVCIYLSLYVCFCILFCGVEKIQNKLKELFFKFIKDVWRAGISAWKKHSSKKSLKSKFHPCPR